MLVSAQCLNPVGVVLLVRTSRSDYGVKLLIDREILFSPYTCTIINTTMATTDYDFILRKQVDIRKRKQNDGRTTFVSQPGSSNQASLLGASILITHILRGSKEKAALPNRPIAYEKPTRWISRTLWRTFSSSRRPSPR